jgi:hypothetical protein
VISTSVSFTVYGDNYSYILSEAKNFVCELFEVDNDSKIESKFNFEIHITDLTDSTDFEKLSYKADVTVKVRNV